MNFNSILSDQSNPFLANTISYPLKNQNSKDYAFKRQPYQIAKHTQTIRRLLRTNCLSVFGHFVGLAFSGSQGNFHFLKNLMTYKSKHLIDE